MADKGSRSAAVDSFDGLGQKCPGAVLAVGKAVGEDSRRIGKWNAWEEVSVFLARVQFVHFTNRKAWFRYQLECKYLKNSLQNALVTMPNRKILAKQCHLVPVQ